MISVILQDAYFHVPILPAFQKYLRVAVGHTHLQFQCLPFGLCASPRVFSKILIAVLAPLRERGLRFFHYLDDILLLAPSPEQLLEHKKILLSTLAKFSWLVNWEKSLLTPTQTMIYLVALFNTSIGTVCLPPQKVAAISQKMMHVRSLSHLSVSGCMSLIGTMSPCIQMLPWAHWHLRFFKVGFLSQWKKQSLHQWIFISILMKRSLLWLTKKDLISKPRHLQCHSWTILTTDASSSGWGAHCDHLTVQGKWDFPTAEIVSNVLEIRVAYLALVSLGNHLLQTLVLLRLDNRAAVSYIQ